MMQKLKNYYHLGMALIANLINTFPARNLTVVGVTGTDGKTTTVSLIYHILKNCGFNVSMISSVGAIINGKKYGVGFHVTNPSSWGLQKFIKMISRKPAKNILVLEVTSHAIDQYRNWGIKFAVAVLTNINQEHLDYHKTYENYVKTKAKLLKMAKVAVLNKDDKSYPLLSKMKFNRVFTYGFSKDTDISFKKLKLKACLEGKFNQYNLLAAIAAVKLLGVTVLQIKHSILDFKLPRGRLEEVYDNDFKYIIDFAHTPNSFYQILSSLRPKIKGRIIHVFGSAGKRDSKKRPEMGRISSQFADIMVLTAEDPRNEPVEEINQDIASGIGNGFKFLDYKQYLKKPKKKVYFMINDRKEAINFAVSIAEKGDLVISTGKGHEESMNYGRGEVPWNEFSVVEGAIKNNKKK